MSDERRSVPAPNSQDSAPTVPDVKAAVSTEPMAVDVPSPPPADVAARRRARMTLRIPDDEVIRPKAPEPEADPVEFSEASVDGGVALKPTRIITLNPPALEPPAESAGETTSLGDDLDDEAAILLVSRVQRSTPTPLPTRPWVSSAASSPRSLAPSMRSPPRAPTLSASPGEPAPQSSLPASRAAISHSPEVLREPTPSPVPRPFAAPGSGVGAPQAAALGAVLPTAPDGELSADDLVVIDPSPVSPKVDAVLPAMRDRLPSNAPELPTTKRAAPAPARRPSKPPLVFVPPHMGSVLPQQPDGSAARRKARFWWEELFNDDYLRSAERITDDQLAREVDFIEESLGVERGGAVLDMACGAGRHAVDLALRGYQVVAFDLSLNMLARAGDEAQERGARLNFMQGDMREMTFAEQFDGVYCWNTSFGYFEEEKNALVIDRIHNALKGGGLLLLDVVNRDFLVQQSPSLAWFEGDGCVCMDEMVVDFITSRMRVKRTMMLDDGRSRELEFSMRVYSLHELGKMLHEHGFKVCEVSGRIATPGVFFGRESARTIILAEKR